MKLPGLAELLGYSKVVVDGNIPRANMQAKMDGVMSCPTTTKKPPKAN